MKLARFSSLVHQISGFGSRNAFHSNFYSTNSKPIRRTTSTWQSSTTELYRRIYPIGDWNPSIVPILDQWIEEGRSVDEQGLKDIISQLRYYNRYNHALEISMWMTDKRNFKLSSSTAAIRLELISKTQGIEQAEKYFNNLLPQKRKGHNAYCTLLNCYAAAQCVEKAEALMQKIKGFGYAKNAKEYNLMLNLYYKTGDMEKLDALLQEMEENGVVHDKYTLGILLCAYASVTDFEKMDKIATVMESDPNLVLDWTNYTAAAAGYTKAGLTDKAFEMLKKAETHVPTKGHKAYTYLLTQYATIGKKDEVLRIWSLYKKKHTGYSHVLSSLVKLGDFEIAEEIFNEWEFQDDLTCDIYIPNIMIAAYSRKGVVEKAEALIDRAKSKGWKPNAWTWAYLAEGYLKNEQPQKAVEMIKKAIVNSETWWKPDMAVSKACLEYLERVGDTEQSEEFANLLKVKDRNIVSLD